MAMLKKMVGGSYCNSMTKVSCLPEKAMPRTTNSPKAMSLALLQPVLQKERNLGVLRQCFIAPPPSPTPF